MEFFDCNTFIGLPTNGALRPVKTAEDLIAQMDRSGIEKALVWHIAQKDYSATAGNKMLAEAIAEHRDRLVGCWTIVPEQTGEMPAPKKFFADMAKAGVKALRAFPEIHRFLLRKEVFGELFEAMEKSKVPLLLAMKSGVGADWNGLYDLLADFPKLTVIMCDVGLWGPDRYIRPLFDRYPNVYVELSEYVVDGGIEGICDRYGPGRLLFGTCFPVLDHGGPMLAIKHSKIPEKSKEMIASGNIERILGGVKLRGAKS